jgi:hypothetical protein
MDVFEIDSGVISISVDVQKISFVNNPFGNRESRLKVRIVNAGETSISDLSLEALAPEGTDLVDPGALFGNSRRHVRIKTLSPKQGITYKLGIRAREGFDSGSLVIRVTRIRVGITNQSKELSLALNSTAVN